MRTTLNDGCGYLAARTVATQYNYCGCSIGDRVLCQNRFVPGTTRMKNVVRFNSAKCANEPSEIPESSSPASSRVNNQKNGQAKLR